MVLPAEFLLTVEIHGGDREELCRLGGGGDAGASVVGTGYLDVGEPGLVGGEGVPDDGGEGLEEGPYSVLRRISSSVPGVLDDVRGKERNGACTYRFSTSLRKEEHASMRRVWFGWRSCGWSGADIFGALKDTVEDFNES